MCPTIVYYHIHPHFGLAPKLAKLEERLEAKEMTFLRWIGIIFSSIKS
jgi:hypothetical protein